jgi:hypothetical protein
MTSFLMTALALCVAPAASLRCAPVVAGISAAVSVTCRRHEPVVLMPRKQAARLILIDGNNLVSLFLASLAFLCLTFLLPALSHETFRFEFRRACAIFADEPPQGNEGP